MMPSSKRFSSNTWCSWAAVQNCMPGELGYVTVKDTCHVVIELVGIRADMHGHYGFVELVFTVGNFVFKKGEVGNGAGVVELHSVGVQAYEFYPSGNERKVGVAEYGAICLFSCAKQSWLPIKVT